MNRLRRLLSSRRVLLWAALVGVLLAAPSLFGGLQTEDHVFRAVARAHPFSLSHVNLWGPALPPSPAARLHDYYSERDLGMLPWITNKDFEVSFWRPLGSLTHHLDFRLWPDSPALMHAQNLFWYALLIAAVALLYRRFCDPLWVAGLAAVVFAVDDAHGQAVGWIANRSAIIAALFAVLALYFRIATGGTATGRGRCWRRCRSARGSRAPSLRCAEWATWWRTRWSWTGRRRSGGSGPRCRG